MTVLTRDILVEGLRRDVVFEWLANFSVHADFLKAGFPNLEVLKPRHLVPSLFRWLEKSSPYLSIWKPMTSLSQKNPN